MGLKVNKAEFAKIIGRSPRQLTRMFDEGMPAKGTGKKGAPVEVDTEEAIWWLVERAQRSAAPAEATTDTETRRLRAAQADKEELEVARRRGEVVPVEDVQDVLNEVAVTYGTQLDAIGGRLANELAAITDPAEIRQRLFAEARAIRASTAEKLEAYARELGSAVGGPGQSPAAADAGSVG